MSWVPSPDEYIELGESSREQMQEEAAERAMVNTARLERDDGEPKRESGLTRLLRRLRRSDR